MRFWVYGRDGELVGRIHAEDGAELRKVAASMARHHGPKCQAWVTGFSSADVVNEHGVLLARIVLERKELPS